MGQTIYVTLSAEKIAANAGSDEVSLYPRLRFRYRQDRTIGAWEVLACGCWAKWADYPSVSCSAMIEGLAAAVEAAELSRKPSTPAPLERFDTVGGVLNWYLDVVTSSRLASPSVVRKGAVRSAITAHLLPALGGVLVGELSRSMVVMRLIEPRRATLAASTIHHLYAILRLALRRCVALGHLQADPLAGVNFAGFKLGKIKPKAAQLRPTQVPALVARLVERFDSTPEAGMLGLLMLMHGTRIGETRQARWRDFHLDEGLWVIPAGCAKTGVAHEIPLTPDALLLLSKYRAKLKRVRNASVYLFPNGDGQPIGATYAGLLIASLSGREWSAHDLRKVARASWAVLEVDYLVCELLLNHSLGVLPATYVQLKLGDKKRAALERWHAELGVLRIIDVDSTL